MMGVRVVRDILRLTRGKRTKGKLRRGGLKDGKEVVDERDRRVDELKVEVEVED